MCRLLSTSARMGLPPCRDAGDCGGGSRDGARRAARRCTATRRAPGTRQSSGGGGPRRAVGCADSRLAPRKRRARRPERGRDARAPRRMACRPRSCRARKARLGVSPGRCRCECAGQHRRGGGGAHGRDRLSPHLDGAPAALGAHRAPLVVLGWLDVPAPVAPELAARMLVELGAPTDARHRARAMRIASARGDAVGARVLAGRPSSASVRREKRRRSCSSSARRRASSRRHPPPQAREARSGQCAHRGHCGPPDGALGGRPRRRRSIHHDGEDDLGSKERRAGRTKALVIHGADSLHRLRDGAVLRCRWNASCDRSCP